MLGKDIGDVAAGGGGAFLPLLRIPGTGDAHSHLTSLTPLDPLMKFELGGKEERLHEGKFHWW